SVCMTYRPSMLVVEPTPDTQPSVKPSLTLTVPGPANLETYWLRGIIYLQNFHFAARMLDSESRIWSYDGRKNNGTPWLDANCRSVECESDVRNLTVLDDRP